MRKDWKKVKVADLGNVITGNTPPRKNPELYGTHTIFIKPTDIQEETRYTSTSEEYYSELGYKKYIKSLIPKGSTCVVTIGSIGKKITQTHCDCFINQNMNSVVPNENYDKDFVFYLMKHNLSQVKGLDSGSASGRDNVSKSSFSNIEVLVPESLATQQKIASILSAYDDLIENNLRRIKLLEEMAAITYKEWFVNFTIDGQKLEIDAETGLPFGWENGCIGNLISFQNGFAFKSEKFTSSGYPVIKIKNIGNRSINIENSDFIDEAYAQSVDKFKLHEGDLLIAMTGATIGKVGYLPKSKKSCFLNQRVGRFQQIDDDFNNKHFAFCAIDSEKGQQQIINLSGGAAQPNISSSQILSMECLIPQREILKKFHELVDVNIKLVLQLYTQNRLLKEARDILLPRLMSGEIELT